MSGSQDEHKHRAAADAAGQVANRSGRCSRKSSRADAIVSCGVRTAEEGPSETAGVVAPLETWMATDVAAAAAAVRPLVDVHAGVPLPRSGALGALSAHVRASSSGV